MPHRAEVARGGRGQGELIDRVLAAPGDWRGFGGHMRAAEARMSSDTNHLIKAIE
jgi:hypothetical protein